MQIKDLITELEALYNTYTDEYKATMGEPEIMIDVFKAAEDYDGYPKLNPCRSLREYAGFSNTIVINKSRDGCYDILNAFYEDHHKEPKTKKSTSSPWPYPESRET